MSNPFAAFACDVAAMLATPEAEDFAATIGPADLPDLLDCLRSTLAAQAAEATALRVLLAHRAQAAYSDPRIGAEVCHQNTGGPEDRKRWRVYHDGAPVGYGTTEAEALLSAIEGKARHEGAAIERDAVTEWLRRNPGIPRGPECITAMGPFELADAIAIERHHAQRSRWVRLRNTGVPE